MERQRGKYQQRGIQDIKRTAKTIKLFHVAVVEDPSAEDDVFGDLLKCRGIQVRRQRAVRVPAGCFQKQCVCIRYAVSLNFGATFKDGGCLAIPCSVDIKIPAIATIHAAVQPDPLIANVTNAPHVERIFEPENRRREVDLPGVGQPALNRPDCIGIADAAAEVPGARLQPFDAHLIIQLARFPTEVAHGIAVPYPLAAEMPLNGIVKRRNVRVRKEGGRHASITNRRLTRHPRPILRGASGAVYPLRCSAC